VDSSPLMNITYKVVGHIENALLIVKLLAIHQG
jgi:hypothetical protein